jgi:hypothetical protein
VPLADKLTAYSLCVDGLIASCIGLDPPDMVEVTVLFSVLMTLMLLALKFDTYNLLVDEFNAKPYGNPPTDIVAVLVLEDRLNTPTVSLVVSQQYISPLGISIKVDLIGVG